MPEETETTRTPEELQQLLDNALAQNSELQGKLDLADATNKNLRERLKLAESGLRMANVDSLPKEVADDARRRMAMGLPETTAIQKALEQYEHDRKLASKGKAVKRGAESPELDDVIEQLVADSEDTDWAKIRGELHNLGPAGMQSLIAELNKRGAALKVPAKEKDITKLVGAVIEAAQAGLKLKKSE